MTAVEWLISQYIKDGVLDKKVYEQALEMEKQQKIEFGKKVADHWGMTEVPIQEIEKFLNETYGSKGSDETKINLVEIPQEQLEKERNPNYKYFDISTSSQTEISEHRFTEKDIRFAYMQGYNRGVDGNPNHMESYIEHLKSTKSSQTEISDEEIEKYANELYYGTNFKQVCITACKWYREQLKKKQ